MGEIEVPALRDITLSIEEGMFIAILGPSGCGKTTLLNLIGGIDRSTEGEIQFKNENIFELSSLSERDLTKYRRKYIGFIFQFYNLVGSLTALENIELAAKLTQPSAEARKISKELLNDVGLGDKMDKFPAQLSGGEQQRVAIARALAKQPKILLADEPSGNLDSETTGRLMKLFKTINKKYKATMIVVTHNVGISYLADRVIYLRDGKIFGISHYDPAKEEEFWQQLKTTPAIDSV